MGRGAGRRLSGSQACSGASHEEDPLAALPGCHSPNEPTNQNIIRGHTERPFFATTWTDRFHRGLLKGIEVTDGVLCFVDVSNNNVSLSIAKALCELRRSGEHFFLCKGIEDQLRVIGVVDVPVQKAAAASSAFAANATSSALLAANEALAAASAAIELQRIGRQAAQYARALNADAGVVDVDLCMECYNKEPEVCTSPYGCTVMCACCASSVLNCPDCNTRIENRTMVRVCSIAAQRPSQMSEYLASMRDTRRSLRR